MIKVGWCSWERDKGRWWWNDHVSMTWLQDLTSHVVVFGFWLESWYKRTEKKKRNFFKLKVEMGTDRLTDSTMSYLMSSLHSNRTSTKAHDIYIWLYINISMHFDHGKPEAIHFTKFSQKTQNWLVGSQGFGILTRFRKGVHIYIYIYLDYTSQLVFEDKNWFRKQNSKLD